MSCEEGQSDVYENKEEVVTQVSHSETLNKRIVTTTVQKKSYSTEKNITAVYRQAMTSGGISEDVLEQNRSVCSRVSKEMTSSSFKTSQIQNVKSYSLDVNEMGALALQNLMLTDIDKSSASPLPEEVEDAKNFYKETLQTAIMALKEENCAEEIPKIISRIKEIICNAWEVPAHGHILGPVTSNILRTSGVLDFILQGLEEPRLEVVSASLLEQCLTSENRDYVAANGLNTVVASACTCVTSSDSAEQCRIGTGILEHLFKSSPGTCSEIIRQGGLDAIVAACAKTDEETLQHCAAALANLSICGGYANHQAVLKRKVPMWLVPLSHHQDTVIKYYSSLALAALSANDDAEKSIDPSKVLDHLESFLATLTPETFVNSDSSRAHGQSKYWLQNLAVLLNSKFVEVQALASFHFCVEAFIKKGKGDTSLLREMTFLKGLKNVISGPNTIASKYATEALWLIH